MTDPESAKEELYEERMGSAIYRRGRIAGLKEISDLMGASLAMSPFNANLIAIRGIVDALIARLEKEQIDG